MDNNKIIRLLASFLLSISGIIHLVMIIFSTGMEILVMGLFGLIYLIIGIGLFFRKKIFIYFGIVFPLVGFFIGTYSYITLKPEIITLFLIIIDIAVILCCFYLAFKKTNN